MNADFFVTESMPKATRENKKSNAFERKAKADQGFLKEWIPGLLYFAQVRLSATFIMSVKLVWRSSALVDSPVSRWSLIVRIVRAFAFPKAALV